MLPSRAAPAVCELEGPTMTGPMMSRIPTIACPSQTRKAATHADGRLECGGAPSGSRTLDLGIKSPLLYQLS